MDLSNFGIRTMTTVDITANRTDYHNGQIVGEEGWTAAEAEIDDDRYDDWFDKAIAQDKANRDAYGDNCDSSLYTILRDGIEVASREVIWSCNRDTQAN